MRGHRPVSLLFSDRHKKTSGRLPSRLPEHTVSGLRSSRQHIEGPHIEVEEGIGVEVQGTVAEERIPVEGVRIGSPRTWVPRTLAAHTLAAHIEEQVGTSEGQEHT